MERKPIGSRRLQALGSSIFSEMDMWKQEAVARGHTLIDLGIGSPDRPPSPRVMAALAAAVNRPELYRYPSSAGTLELRKAISRWFARKFGVQLDPEREVLVLMGTQDGLAHLGLALADPGDIAFVPNPCYPIYAANLALAGIEPYELELSAVSDFMPDFTAIPDEVAERARFLLLGFPSNPLTVPAEPQMMYDAVSFCRRHEIVFAHDYAYSEMLFGGLQPFSALQVSEAKSCTIEFHSFSKSFQMAGCRIGFAVGNEHAIAALRTLKSNIDYGVFLAIQEAAIVALEEDTEEVARLYESRSEEFVRELNRAGWRVKAPQATMFVWAPVPAGWTSRAFARQLLLETGVVVTPGDAFGRLGEGYVRLALVQELPLLRDAVRRIQSFLEVHVDGH